MIKKAKANVGIGLFGEKKQETLIELQDNRSQKQIHIQQQQEEQNLRMLEEQEANIRQLEVCCIHMLCTIDPQKDDNIVSHFSRAIS